MINELARDLMDLTNNKVDNNSKSIGAVQGYIKSGGKKVLLDNFKEEVEFRKIETPGEDNTLKDEDRVLVIPVNNGSEFIVIGKIANA